MKDEHHEKIVQPEPRLRCRNCKELIDVIIGGCNVHEDEQGVQVCMGFYTLDMSVDIVMEYDELCGDCWNKSSAEVPRVKGFTESMIMDGEYTLNKEKSKTLSEFVEVDLLDR